jgi:hypothetical protein
MAEQSDELKQVQYERRAPGWVIRCLKCGLTEPWGKYGIRLQDIGRKWPLGFSAFFQVGGGGVQWTLGWCSRCRWIRCHVIEKPKTK